jgi:hypothetical protein
MVSRRGPGTDPVPLTSRGRGGARSAAPTTSIVSPIRRNRAAVRGDGAIDGTRRWSTSPTPSAAPWRGPIVVSDACWVGRLPRRARQNLLVIASGLALQDPRERPLEVARRSDAAHQGFVGAPSCVSKLWSAASRQGCPRRVEAGCRRSRRCCANGAICIGSCKLAMVRVADRGRCDHRRF